MLDPLIHKLVEIHAKEIGLFYRIIIFKKNEDFMNCSGGPLMTRTTDGLWEIVGITSYGKGCGRINELGVYTRVSMYINWIDMTIKNLEGYTFRSFDKPKNIFLNSANNSQNYLFIIILLFYL